MNSYVRNENLKILFYNENKDIWRPAQWFRGMGLLTPKNRDAPRKAGHLATLLLSKSS